MPFSMPWTLMIHPGAGGGPQRPALSVCFEETGVCLRHGIAFATLGTIYRHRALA